MCPHDAMIRDKGEMSLSLFKKIVDQTIDTIWEYSLNMMGEPTMCSQLPDMIDYVKSKGGRVALYTNLNYRDDGFTEYLVRKKVDRVIVNMCALDKYIYREVTGRGDYSLVIHNLQKIKEYKSNLRNKKPKVIASLLRMTKNIGQDKKLKKEFKKYFNYYTIRKMHDWLGYKNTVALRPEGICYGSKKKCSNLWTTVTVLWDGKIVLCSHDYKGEVILGNAVSDDLTYIWNSFRMKQIRKRYQDLSLCRKCKDDTMKFQFSVKNIYNYVRTSI
jgi:radical SAM protein with 4Fe4S-binding SPASM domain